MSYKYIIRPILFLFDPETIHNLIISILKVPGISKLIKWIYSGHKHYEYNFLGLKFSSRVGLAAGFDKNAELIDHWADLGFGFIEIGTVTPLAQAGNNKPRLFRLKEDKALIIRMGFNNDGVEVIRNRLQKRKSPIIIGGNIGKNKDTPNENADEDYAICFETLFDFVDYFVVNVSSPNTPGLRELQERGPLEKILHRLQDLNNQKSKRKPILLKIAPDLTKEQLDTIVEIVKTTKTDGIIATNTTVERVGLQTPEHVVAKIGDGGLSGMPLREKSTAVIRHLAEKSQGAVPIIGVGGIHSSGDAWEKIKAGAGLLQVYTGFIYEGPDLIRRVNKEVIESV